MEITWPVVASGCFLKGERKRRGEGRYFWGVLGLYVKGLRPLSLAASSTNKCFCITFHDFFELIFTVVDREYLTRLLFLLQP